MLLVGLTGGIGAGKSLVSDFFAELGVPVLDADEIAHELVAPGTPALADIARVFGPGVIDPQGRLDRSYLRTVVFENTRSRAQLEDILHPRILEEMRRRAETLASPYCILSIPLLVEKKLFGMVDRVLVVDAPHALQVARATHRDGTDPDEIQNIIASQADRETRLAAADDVIVNDSDLDTLRRSVRALHDRYLRLAGGPTH